MLVPSLLIVALSSALTLIANANPANATVNWFPCPDAVGFDCAFYDVPMSYDPQHRLYNSTVSIALRKRPATDPNAPYIFLNYGGPGLSGTKFLVSKSFRQGIDSIPKQLDGVYNWVAFDPRGVNMTLPSLDCYTDSYTAWSDWNSWASLGYGPDYRRQLNTNQMSLGEYTASVWGYAGASFALKGLLKKRCKEFGNQDMLQSISTALTARDMKTLAQAMGQSQLNYYGYSYGTVLGQTFAAMFPEWTGKMVIDGVWDADLYTNDLVELAKLATIDYEAVLDLLFADCAAAGAVCAMNNGTITPLATSNATGPALKWRYENQFTLLASRPSAGPNGTLNIANLLDHAIDASRYGAYDKRALVQYVASLENDTQIRQQEYKQPNFGDHTNTPFTRFMDTAGSISNYGIHTIVCGDTRKFSSTLEDITSQMYNISKINSYGEFFSNFHISACSDWGYEQTEVYRGPWEGQQVITRTPVLVASSRLDPVTPLQMAQTVSKRLRGSSLVVVEQGAHSADAGRASECYTDIIKAYFANATLPEYGTSCKLNQPNPFLN